MSTNYRLALTHLSVTVLAIAVADISVAAWGQPFLDTLAANDALKVTSDAHASAESIVWAMKAASLVSTSILLYLSGKSLHVEDYYRALWTFMGAVIAGASPFFAETLFFG